MNDLEFTLKQGDKVFYAGQECRIKFPLNLSKVIVERIIDSKSFEVDIADLAPIASPEASSSCRENILFISEEDWEKAKHREKLLKPFAERGQCTKISAKDLGQELGISWRQVYSLLNKYKDSGYQLSALLPTKPSGGKNKPRIHSNAESVITAIINELYLNEQRLKISKVIEEIKLRCASLNIQPPGNMTIRRRIAQLSHKLVTQKRLGAKVAQHISNPVSGSFPQVNQPLSVLQIDHTSLDLIIVDEVYRQPIGRPYLTVAIDVFSRCVTGFCLTLEAPSATSVGLCLTHSVFDKDDWLLKRNLKSNWPIWGKPDSIYVDNAKEFHSEALQRGCDLHGIKINFRPVGQPHYGGIVERLIGTLMQLVHQLPGTTFANVQERKDYDSEGKSVLTLSELERWLTIAITDYYHQKLHEGIQKPPIEKYKEGILGDGKHEGRGYPAKIYNRKAFLVDFLPLVRRSLQRHGFMIDHIAYYNNSLSPLIANRKKYDKFIIRQDPRDLSCVYVLDPISKNYLEIPYRTISRPTITLWEHRHATNLLHEKGYQEVDEGKIFSAIESMREIAKNSTQQTKRVRRFGERTKHAIEASYRSGKGSSVDMSEIDDKDSATSIANPYEDIETW